METFEREVALLSSDPAVAEGRRIGEQIAMVVGKKAGLSRVPWLVALALAAVLISFSGSPCTRAAEDAPDPDEQLLKAYHVPVDGASLLDFFRQQSASQANRLHMEQMVRQLGSRQFAEREQASGQLADWGQPALPFLTRALRDPDQEVARRAKDCIAEITRGPGPNLPMAALRLLTRLRPAGAVRVLLEYAPAVDDLAVEEELLTILGQLGVHQGVADPALVQALRDPQPSRRAAAAAVVGRRGNVGQRDLVRQLLADPDIQVRFRAAQGLLATQDKSAVPVLLGLLKDAPTPLAWQVEDLLFQVAGDQAPGVSIGAGAAAARRQAAVAWDAWWRQQDAGVNLAGLEERPGSFTVVVEPEVGAVWECGPDGQRRWQLQGLQGPMDARVLPGGRILIPEILGQRVTERDLTGKVLWQKQLSQEFPLACQRLPGGNTFIATRHRLLEVRPDGTEAFSYKPPADFIVIAAERLRDRHLVCLSSNGTVMELDPAGKVLTSLSLGRNAGGWGGVEKLANGHFLVALEAVVDGVREVDRDGQVVWQYALPKAGPGYATRLPNGNTLIADATLTGHRILVVDHAGKVVWEQATTGRPLRAHRR